MNCLHFGKPKREKHNPSFHQYLRRCDSDELFVLRIKVMICKVSATMLQKPFEASTNQRILHDSGAFYFCQKQTFHVPRTLPGDCKWDRKKVPDSLEAKHLSFPSIFGGLMNYDRSNPGICFFPIHLTSSVGIFWVSHIQGVKKEHLTKWFKASKRNILLNVLYES